MANRDLLNDMLGKRWTDTDSPNSGTAVSISSNTHLGEAAPNPDSRYHLETLIYSINNRTGAGATPATVTVHVRHATVAGTVIAAIDHLVGASAVVNVSMTNLGIPSKKGKAIRVTMDTVVASLTQK